MLELWTKIDYQMSPPCIDSLTTSPKESHGGTRTKCSVLDQRLVCEVIRILYKRFNFVKIQYNSSASSYMIMMPCLLMIMMIMKNLSELPFSQRWEKQQGWPCKKRWWSTWRTTRSLQQFALRRPEQPRKWIIYNFTLPPNWDHFKDIWSRWMKMTWHMVHWVTRPEISFETETETFF